MIFFHNWKDTYKVRYGFETVIFSSQFKREQRRPVRTTPTMSVEIKTSLLTSTELFNFLGGNLTTVYLPFEVEKFTGTRGSPSTKIVTAVTDISSFFNLSYLKTGYIIDSDGNVGEITGVSGSTISLTADLAGTSTEMYYCIKAILKEAVPSFITDEKAEMTLVLEKVKE